MGTTAVTSACWKEMRNDVKNIAMLAIQTHDLWIQKQVSYTHYTAAPT